MLDMILKLARPHRKFGGDTVGAALCGYPRGGKYTTAWPTLNLVRALWLPLPCPKKLTMMGANSCITANAGSDLLASATRRSQRGGHPARPHRPALRFMWSLSIDRFPLLRFGRNRRVMKISKFVSLAPLCLVARCWLPFMHPHAMGMVVAKMPLAKTSIRGRLVLSSGPACLFLQ